MCTPPLVASRWVLKRGLPLLWDSTAEGHRLAAGAPPSCCGHPLLARPDSAQFEPVAEAVALPPLPAVPESPPWVQLVLLASPVEPVGPVVPELPDVTVVDWLPW